MSALPPTDLDYRESETRGSRPQSRVSELVLPYWRSSEAPTSAAMAAVIIGLSFTSVYIGVWSNQWSGRFYDAIGAARFAAIPHLLLSFLGVVLVAATLVLIGYVLHELLVLRWRTWLTRHLIDAWTAGDSYFRIERDKLFDNADQRIAEDVRLFVSTTLRLSFSIISVPVSAFTFSVVLWKLTGAYTLHAGGATLSIPGYMVLAVFAYTGATLLITHVTGRRLMFLNAHQQRVEADFRAMMLQLREGAEQVAFYGGAATEATRLKRSFALVRGNALDIIRVTSMVMFSTQVPGQISSILPALLALPQMAAHGLTVGWLMRVSSAFGSVAGTLAFFPQCYQEFATLRAVTRRLLTLLDATRAQAASPAAPGEAAAPRLALRRHDGPGIAAGALRLTDQNGATLARTPAFVIAAGSHHLIRGRSGSGKSTLLRAMAGIWPYGEGALSMPPREALMFVPQRSYIATGSLRDALAYPLTGDTLDTARADAVLRRCGLAHYADSLDVVDRWAHRLSGGEQQRLAFARILLQRPAYLFLDEATSALDETSERTLYRTMLDALPHATVVSVAHRPGVAAFHEHVIELGMHTAAPLETAGEG
ncbi:ABC transporter ATP-binding protein/permease [Burkholderia sp. Ac-20379]|uniref:ABC transporter ATP-binding protein/permease n=1 Tax=Burkholderia sp. Ac-20379 TaxID=2703900 RepID=UPI0019808531|nr:ABC transporter ATP-binding protein/permease [Burkholderia sp. Ac-20379]MBN3725230.1 ABC transporter ATP-binding protein/permease [Burkholderia sp. Ac-20379]